MFMLTLLQLNGNMDFNFIQVPIQLRVENFKINSYKVPLLPVFEPRKLASNWDELNALYNLAVY